MKQYFVKILPIILLGLPLVSGSCSVATKNNIAIPEKGVQMKKTVRNLREFSRMIYGGMLGAKNSVDITRLDDGQAKMVFSEKTSWDAQETSSSIVVSVNILKEIEEVFNKYSMDMWSEEKLKEIFVCDGPTTRYYFGLDDGDVNVSSQAFPDGYYQKVREIDDIIDKYKKD